MKKVFVFIIPILFLSCGSQKLEKLKSEKKINKILELKSVIINSPENWIYKLNHNSISYTPIDLNDIFYNCMIDIFKFNGSILEIGPILQTQKSKEELMKMGLPIKMQTRFGETDMYKITAFNKIYDKPIETITLILHFSYKNEYYVLRYQANKKYFDKYLKDVDYFIDNLEFKIDKITQISPINSVHHNDTNQTANHSYTSPSACVTL